VGAAAASTTADETSETQWGWIAFGILAAAVVIGGIVWWWRRRSAKKGEHAPPGP
jgi:membrane protein DedA with SNARE-associated domain